MPMALWPSGTSFPYIDVLNSCPCYQNHNNNNNNNNN